MPTIMRQAGFRLVINTADHDPAHVHCLKGDIVLIIEVESLAIRDERGPVKAQDRRTARDIIVEHRQTLLARWDEYHA